jgi:hypothetical protein
MKNIKKFDEFQINEEEGWKDALLGTAIAAGSLLPGQMKASPSGPGPIKVNKSGIEVKWPGKEVTKTLHKKVTDEKSLERLQKKGYNLDSTVVDTLFKELTETAPETVIKGEKIIFGDNQYFASGVYTISPEMADSVSQVINNIESSNHTIIGIQIQSSTDKQGLSIKLQNELKAKGYEPNNKGLAKARCESISKYIIENEGIDDSLIDTAHLFEMGQGKQDPSARFVTVKIIYLENDVVIKSNTIKKISPEESKTYYLSKDVKSQEYHRIKIKFPHIKLFHHHGKVKHYKNISKCFGF